MKNLLLLLFLLTPICLFSLVNSSYTYTYSTSTWASNSSPTSIHSSGVDDALSTSINIGFTFVYDGSSYTQFKASTNGFITLNTANVNTQPTNNLNTSSERTILAVLWDDNRIGSSGNVNYKLTGASPNRVLTIEWLGLRWNKFGYSSGTIDCQIKLYETTNIIEYIYNRGTYQSFINSSGIGASIGISGSLSGDFISLSDIKSNPTTSTSTETTTIGSTPTNFQSLTSAQVNAIIVNGTKYTFTPIIPLPVELLYFKGYNRETYNHLVWVTASESNNDYFTIQKTYDGITYFDIAFIKGAGHSTTEIKYEYDDYDINNSACYYRLKQTDFDGKLKYHTIISLDNSKKIRIVVRVINLYGADVDIHKKGVLILIYDDGSVKKIFNE